jgi:glycine betaine/proline transport system ATP-binding protein
MRKSKDDYGYYINEDGYQGVITQETLEGVEQSEYDKAIDPSLLDSVPAVHTDALLEAVIPETLDSEHPLPVINADGDVEGRLSRSTLAEVLSDQAGVDEGDEKVKKLKTSKSLAA